MKLCISNIAWDEKFDEQVYALCIEMGYDGIEIAPSRIFYDNPYEKSFEAKNWSKSLKDNYGLTVCSCQSIWYGRKENIFNSSEERDVLLEYSKKAFYFMSCIGAKNVVFGCPQNRSGYKNNIEINRAIAIDFVGKLIEQAKMYQLTISIEANPDIYGTDFLNTTKEVIGFIKEINNQSLRLNLDIGTMLYYHEHPNIIVGNERMIGHVHFSEPYLMKVQKRPEHYEVMSVLKNGYYDKAISIEMKKQDSIKDIKGTMNYIKSILLGSEDTRL